MKDRIREARKAKSLTQSQLGELIGVKSNTIAQYESGNREPSNAVINSICRELNVNEDWLRTGNGEMFVEQTRDEQISEFVGKIQHLEDDSFKKRMISMLSKLNESDWEVLERMALEMSKGK